MRAEVVISTEKGEQLARYSGLPLDAVHKVIVFLDWVLGSARVIGDVKRQISGAFGPATPRRGKR